MNVTTLRVFLEGGFSFSIAASPAQITHLGFRWSERLGVLCPAIPVISANIK